MKKLKRFTLILIILISNVSFAFSNDKIVFFDLDLVIKKSNIGMITLKKINKLNNENIQKLKAKENELKKQENEIKKKQNIISESDLEFLRPCPSDALSPYQLKKVLNKKLLIQINKGDFLKWQDIE